MTSSSSLRTEISDVSDNDDDLGGLGGNSAVAGEVAPLDSKNNADDSKHLYEIYKKIVRQRQKI